MNVVRGIMYFESYCGVCVRIEVKYWTPSTLLKKITGWLDRSKI